MKDLSIDLDVLQSTYNLINTKYEEFSEIFKRLNQSMENLRNSQWKSSASDEFFKNYDDSWKKDIEIYLGILDKMNSELEYVNSNYNELNELRGFPKTYYM